MNRRALLSLFVLWLAAFAAGAHAEPKAYDLVKYQGKAGGVTLLFGFADGYPEASGFKITDGKKTAAYRLQSTDKMQFVSQKAAVAGIKSVSLDMSADDAAPEKVTGSYVAGGKTVTFTLTKKK